MLNVLFGGDEFYKKLGYSECGRIENFVAGHARVYMQKSLVTATG
jgi:hypothetical protein